MQDKEKQIEELKQQLQLAWCDQRDLFFARILGGGYFHSVEELRAAGEAVEVQFPYKNFLVMAARVETWGELFTEGHMDWRDIYFILRNVLQNSFPGVTSAAEVKGRIIAVLNMEELPAMGLRGIVQDTRHALEVLENEFGLTVTVAISRVYHSPMELHDAMEDAEHVFEYQQLLDEDYPITTYEELTYRHVPQSETSFLDLETRLLACVREADFGGMRMVLHELINNEFGEARPTVDTFRFRLYGVVNTLLYLMNEIRKIVGDSFVDEALDPGPRLTQAKNLEDIVTVMDDIMDKLELRTTEQQKIKVPSWVEKVHKFVRENYRDPNLTVSYIADQFGMTPTYCSKVFREQYGIRLFDFIQLRRLEAAKLLMDTDHSLKDIAEATGFSSALTMSRAFKRYDGLAPSKVREQRK